jgi:hypothetical protein
MPVKVAVHVEVPGPLTEAGAQASDWSVTVAAAAATTPPVPESETLLPSAEAASGEFMATAAELSEAVVFAVTTASIPLGMLAAFIPATTQV